MVDNEKIKIDQIIAGALLKFGYLDSVDLIMILENFEDTTGRKIIPFPYMDNIGRSVKFCKNGDVKFRGDDGIDEEEKNRFKSVAGDAVMQYFSKLDVADFKVAKENYLKNGHEELKEKARVLVITDEDEEYQAVVDYGFKCVDRFKSIVVASQYFEKFPKELEQYHIIIKGNQEVRRCNFWDVGKTELEKQLDYAMERKNGSLCASIYRYDSTPKFKTFLGDPRYHTSGWWDTEVDSCSELINKIAENAILNHTLYSAQVLQKEFVPIKEYVNPKIIPLPIKKSDLKILYLDACKVNIYAEEVAKRLGLNIEFKEDSNPGLEDHVKTHLGEYDIIIASNLYSSNLLRQNKECAEQGRITGRNLTMLATYNEQPLLYDCEDGNWSYGDLGEEITLRYIFGGVASESNEREEKIFRIPTNFPFVNEAANKYQAKDACGIDAIIESSVNLYNDYLIKIGEKPLADLDFKTAEQYGEEYQKVEETDRKRKEEVLAPIKAFEKMEILLKQYIDYKNKRLITSNPEGLLITETESDIRVEVRYGGQSLCVISISKDLSKDNFGKFTIQTMTNKGKLSSPETVGVYTKKYDGVIGVPKRADEKQVNAMMATSKKVQSLLRPLISDAREKLRTLESQRRNGSQVATKRKR